MNARDVIAKVTSLSPKVQDDIWEQVKANQTKLDGCVSPHDFSICLDRTTKTAVDNPTPQQRFGARWRCSKCGGDVDHHAKMWYALGLKHAGEQSTKRDE